MSHSCHICGKYFSKPINLHRHKREVHDQKPTDNIRMVTNGSASFYTHSRIVNHRLYDAEQRMNERNHGSATDYHSGKEQFIF